MLFNINLKAVKSKMTKILPITWELLATTATSLLIAVIILFLSARAPEFHGLLIRNSVGTKVYTVRSTLNGGGGTGFAVKARSGQTYIVTNDHVCESSKDKRSMLVVDDEGRYIKRNIIAQSDFSDLCLLEGVPGVEGLELGSPPSVGQIVAAVGHPALRPVTLTRGEIIGSENIEIPVGLIADEPTQPAFGISFFTREECSRPKNRIREVKTIFGNMVMCTIVTEGAYTTNVLIQPGSSGSPVVNFWGNVVAVVFAGDNYGWGSLVSFNDLENFLSMY